MNHNHQRQTAQPRAARRKTKRKRNFGGSSWLFQTGVCLAGLGSDSEPRNGFGKWSHLCPIRLRFGAGFSSRMDGFEAPSRLGFASWRWCKHLMSKVPAGNKALMDNMDEAAIQLFLDCWKNTSCKARGPLTAESLRAKSMLPMHIP